MSVTLYNEGRVCGYSAYEVYVKQHASVDPDTDPATERQWLASSLAMGSSMLLKLPKDTDHDDDEVWMYEVNLPSTTRLCAANTIIGNFFKGDAHISSGVWADRVTDYGSLLSNTSSSSPSGSTTSSSASSKLPYSLADWTDDEKEQLINYLKILDGMFIQPGTWSTGTNTPPQKDFVPDLSDLPRLRLEIKGPITSATWVLFTGFTLRTVVNGETGLDSATDTPYPEDGDFLGPGQFPWASRVVFSVPSSYVTYYELSNYRRTLPVTCNPTKTGSILVIDDTSVIDMKTTQPETYYATQYNTKAIYSLYTDTYVDPRLDDDVDEFSTLGDGEAVITVYQKSKYYAPALWGTYVTSTGDNYLNPLDVVAPGTVKMFYNQDEDALQDYQDTFPGTSAMNRTEDGKIEILDKDGNIVPAADVTTQSLIYYSGTTQKTSSAKGVVTTTGQDSELSLSMGPGGGDASQYTIHQDTTSDEGLTGSMTETDSATGNIYWQLLLEALVNDRSIDVLGTNLKQQKVGLKRNYIQFQNGLRLYIAASAPGADSSDPNGSAIPVGSIGIGWS